VTIARKYLTSQGRAFDFDGLVFQRLPDEYYVEACIAKLTDKTLKTTRKVDGTEETKALSLVAANLLYSPVAFSASTGVPEVTMADGMQKDWRELCVAVTNETNSTKLTSLVQELIEALDRGERSRGYASPMSDTMSANQHTA